MFRIDVCRFFYTPAREGICLHLLDQEIFFVPSSEPVYLEQSMVIKQQIIFHYGVKAVLLYSSETWRITVNKIQTLVNRYLRKEEKRKRGRPRNTWRRDMELKVRKMGYTWQDIVTMVQRRIQWRAFIDGPCSQED